MKVLKTYSYEDGVFDFEGAVSIEQVNYCAIPWRIQYKRKEFYPVLEDGVGRCGSGIRLVFQTNTTTLQLELDRLKEPTQIDCVINGNEIRTIAVESNSIEISDLHQGNKQIALWLPQNQQLHIKGIGIDLEATISKQTKEWPKWIHYGSSISQSNDVQSPARTWVSKTARCHHLDVTNLGFSGECVFDPIVGRQIRDMDADLITLKLGVNTYPGKSTERLFKPNVIGLIDTIREGHPKTLIVVISPFYSREREVILGPTGLSLTMMRTYLEEIVQLYRQAGDDHIYYVNGLEIFGSVYESYLPDGLHPNAEAQSIIAHQFGQKVISPLFEDKYL